MSTDAMQGGAERAPTLREGLEYALMLLEDIEEPAWSGFGGSEALEPIRAALAETATSNRSAAALAGALREYRREHDGRAASWSCDCRVCQRARAAIRTARGEGATADGE